MLLLAIPKTLTHNFFRSSCKRGFSSPHICLVILLCCWTRDETMLGKLKWAYLEETIWLPCPKSSKTNNIAAHDETSLTLAHCWNQLFLSSGFHMLLLLCCCWSACTQRRKSMNMQWRVAECCTSSLIILWPGSLTWYIIWRRKFHSLV